VDFRPSQRTIVIPTVCAAIAAKDFGLRHLALFKSEFLILARI